MNYSPTRKEYWYSIVHIALVLLLATKEKRETEKNRVEEKKRNPMTKCKTHILDITN